MNDLKRNKAARRDFSSGGFTLVELMVAMTIFLVIGGTAMSLFSQHANLFTTQQGEVGLNMTLRNALQQIQTDAVQAGNDVSGARVVRRNEQLRVGRGKAGREQPRLYLAGQFRRAHVVRRASVDHLAKDLARDLAGFRRSGRRCADRRVRNEEGTDNRLDTGKALLAARVLDHRQDYAWQTGRTARGRP